MKYPPLATAILLLATTTGVQAGDWHDQQDVKRFELHDEAAATIIMMDDADVEVFVHKFGKHAAKRFKRLDENDDGLVTQEEFQASRRSFLARLDADADGSLTLDEMRAQLDERMQAKRERLAKRHEQLAARMEKKFQQADADGDGRVTQEEAQQAAFARLDSDEDGYIDADELAEAKARRHGKRWGKHGKRWRKHHWHQ